MRIETRYGKTIYGDRTIWKSITYHCDSRKEFWATLKDFKKIDSAEITKLIINTTEWVKYYEHYNTEEEE